MNHVNKWSARSMDPFPALLGDQHAWMMNMAEIELSVLKRQCLDRRIADMETMQAEVAAWEQGRNNRGMKIDWQFATSDAQIKLKLLYPKF